MSTEDALCAQSLVSMSISKNFQEAEITSAEDARCEVSLVSMSFSQSLVVFSFFSVPLLTFCNRLIYPHKIMTLYICSVEARKHRKRSWNSSTNLVSVNNMNANVSRRKKITEVINCIVI